MNPAFFLQRLRRIVTRPPEVVYALARHWLMIITLFVIGGVIAWAVVMNQPDVYLAKAQLTITEPGNLDPTDDVIMTPRFGPQASAFILSQQNIVKSEDVIRKALGPLIPKDILLLPAEEREKSVFQKITGKISEWLQLTQEEPDESLGLERYLDQSVRIFMDRMNVEVRPESSALNLRLLGIDRDRLRKEMQSWIAAYRDEAKSSRERLHTEALDSLIAAKQKLVDREKQALEAYRAKNPQVSQGDLDILRQKQYSLQGNQGRLEVDLAEASKEFVPPQPAFQQKTVDQRVVELNKQIGALEAQRADLKIRNNLRDDAEPIVHFDEEIAKLRAQLAQVRTQPDTATNDDAAYKAMVDAAFKRYQERQRQLKAELEEAETELAQVTAKISQLTFVREQDSKLETRYEDALAELRAYETQRMVLPNNAVLVEVTNGPIVSAEPANIPRLLQIAIGTGAGLLLGIILSLLAEAIYTKVRFKHDVISDFGLPVLVVFPK